MTTPPPSKDNPCDVADECVYAIECLFYGECMDAAEGYCGEENDPPAAV
jgi:hypothetical protein